MEDVVQWPAHVDVLRDVLVDEREIGRGNRCSMFLMSPVMRLSMATTWKPSRTNRSHRWEPRKPRASGDQYAFCRIHVVVGLGRPMLW